MEIKFAAPKKRNTTLSNYSGYLLVVPVMSYLRQTLSAIASPKNIIVREEEKVINPVYYHDISHIQAIK